MKKKNSVCGKRQKIQVQFDNLTFSHNKRYKFCQEIVSVEEKDILYR